MKAWIAPILLLAMILTASILNCRAMVSDVSRWRGQLEEVELFALAGDWEDARDALSLSYDDWSTRQIYLHIVAEHSAVDGADCLYRRCAALAAAEKPVDLCVELAALRHQLRLLAEMERFSVKNVL